MPLTLTAPPDGRAQSAPAFWAGLRAWPLVRCLALYRLTPWRFLVTLGLYVLLNASLVWQQWLLGQAVNAIKSGLPAAAALVSNPMLGWLSLLSAVAVGRALLQYIAAIFGLLIQQQLLTNLRGAIFSQIQALPLSYHWLHGTGEMITRTTRDADKVRDALTSFWRQGVDSVLVIVAAMVFLLGHDLFLGLVPVALTWLALALLVRQADGLVGLDRALGKAYDQVNQEVSEGVHGARVIKAFALEAERVARFTTQVKRFMQLAESALAYAAWRVPVPQMLVGFAQVWVLGWGLALVWQGRLQAGELVAALLMVNMLVFRMEGIGRVIKIYADARSSAARIWEFLDMRSDVTGGSLCLPGQPFGVRMQGVRVLPPGGGNPVLEDVTLTLEPGGMLAIVGATGSGKSTLAGLFPRLVDPQSGCVLIGHDDQWRDVRLYELDALRRRVQVVTQDNFLFADTLASNLRLSAPGAQERRLWAALTAACADDFVRALPDGLETRLGDRGITLSGGQRQRLCVARALLAQPAILVLDDATSALDTVTERRLLHNLRTLSGWGNQAPAVLLTSNRRASLLQADRVLLLQQGRIAAQGTHAELARTVSAYRELMGVDDHGR